MQHRSTAKRQPKVRLMETASFPCAPKTGRAENRPEAWFRSEKHMEWLRTLPCHYCGRPSGDPRTQPCHQRKGTDGAGEERPSDFYCWPGCPTCHRTQHFIGEVTFHNQRGTLDPVALVLSYAERSPCERTRKAAAAVLAGKPWMEAFGGR